MNYANTKKKFIYFNLFVFDGRSMLVSISKSGFLKKS